jgi:hypothetical protein
MSGSRWRQAVLRESGAATAEYAITIMATVEAQRRTEQS